MEVLFGGVVPPAGLEAQRREQVYHGCVSFYYRAEIPKHRQRWRETRARVLVDSGAFSVWKLGADVSREDYLEFALALRELLRDELRALDFVNFDVVGNQPASWANWDYLVRNGLAALPVLTWGCPVKDIDRALNESEYVCCGGLPGKSRRDAQPWLDTVFARWRAVYERGKQVRVHMLGVGDRRWILERYPAYTSDASSWLHSVRWGKATWVDGSLPSTLGTARDPTLPAFAVHVHALRENIRVARRVEREVTELWALRGVTWPDL